MGVREPGTRLEVSKAGRIEGFGVETQQKAA